MGKHSRKTSPELSAAHGPDVRVLMRWAGAAALVLAVLTAYYPAAEAGYIWDDDAYVTENEFLNDLDGLRAIWIPGNTPQYYPAVFTAFWIENHIWGLDPHGYHLINIILHALNALLVWRLARKLKIPGAGFIAAVFALHPVHVESVAWITERKNVMSGAFYLSSALAYLRFRDEDRAPQSSPKRTWGWYGASLGLFFLALLAKSVTASLPAVLILIMLWRRDRITIRQIALLAPMFILGAGLGLHTAHLERIDVGAMGEEYDFSLAQRFLIAGKALVFYTRKLLAPWPLIFNYPRWQLDTSNLVVFWPLLLVLVVAIVAIVAFARGIRGPALALAYFAGTLFPALGFLNVYPMRYSFVADHFQYLASLGIIALVVSPIAAHWPSGRPKLFSAAALLAVLGVLTWRQCWNYEDEETLWRATIRDNPQSSIAYNELAIMLTKQGKDQEGLENFKLAYEHAPTEKSRRTYLLNTALTLFRIERYAEAEGPFSQIMEFGGDLRLQSLVPYASSLQKIGKPQEAIPYFQEWVDERPESANARMYLADAYAVVGQFDDAIGEARQALSLAQKENNADLVQRIGQRIAQYRAYTSPPPQ